MGEGSRVEAKVVADAAEIAGTYKGELNVRSLVLLDKGRAEGRWTPRPSPSARAPRSTARQRGPGGGRRPAARPPAEYRGAVILRELAASLGCAVRGDGDVEVRRVAGIDESGPGDLTFVANSATCRGFSPPAPPR
jgi:hypothetical protein